jgi:hypothetical protein
MLAWMQNGRSSRSTKVSNTKLIGLILGPVLFLIFLVSPAPEGLPDQGKTSGWYNTLACRVVGH